MTTTIDVLIITRRSFFPAQMARYRSRQGMWAHETIVPRVQTVTVLYERRTSLQQSWHVVVSTQRWCLVSNHQKGKLQRRSDGQAAVITYTFIITTCRLVNSNNRRLRLPISQKSYFLSACLPVSLATHSQGNALSLFACVIFCQSCK